MSYSTAKYNWIIKELESLETPEETRRRKEYELMRQIEMKRQYDELQLSFDYCRKLCTEIFGEGKVRQSQCKKSTSWIEQIPYKSRIDTIEMKDTVENRIENEIIDVKGTRSRCNGKDTNTIITRFNPNNTTDIYSEEYRLSVTMFELAKMKSMLGIKDESKLCVRRVDIATDIDKEFDSISKFLDLMHKCIRADDKLGFGWRNLDENSLTDSNYMYRNRNKYEIEFYNKYKQSGGISPMPTRLEIRLLRVSSDNLKHHIKRVCELWKRAPENIDLVELEMVEVLKKEWRIEKNKNPKLDFASFVYGKHKYIYTQKILQSLYKETGLKRAYRSWLQDYRKKYPIDLYSMNDLKKFSKKVVKSLNEYRKS